MLIKAMTLKRTGSVWPLVILRLVLGALCAVILADPLGLPELGQGTPLFARLLFWLLWFGYAAGVHRLFGIPLALALFSMQGGWWELEGFRATSSHFHIVAVAIFLSSFGPIDRLLSVSWIWRQLRGIESSHTGPIGVITVFRYYVMLIYLCSALLKANLPFLSGFRMQQILMETYFGSDRPEGWWFVAICVLMAWGAFVVELLIAASFWKRSWRVSAVLSGIAFHVAIQVLLPVGVFSFLMVMLLLLLLPASFWASAFRDPASRSPGTASVAG